MGHPLVDMIAAFEPRDLVAVATTEGLLPVLRVILGAAPDGEEARVDDRDPEFAAKFFAGMEWLGRWWFRHRAYGVEHVPARGAALLVGNHSGGITPTDWALAVTAIWRHHGPERAVYGMAHDFLQWSPVLRKYGAKVGALRAGHATAREAFARGHLAIVYPGSDHDAFRPFAERDRVVLGGRTGFIELALREQVPIVPVVTAGAQEQYVALSRGERLAALLDMKRRLRTKFFPLGWSVPWGFGPTLLPVVPLPTQITTAFLPPLSWPDLGPEAADDPAALRRCYDEVEALMQARLDTLTLGRVPWLGQV